MTGALTNPKNLDLNNKFNMNLIKTEIKLETET